MGFHHEREFVQQNLSAWNPVAPGCPVWVVGARNKIDLSQLSHLKAGRLLLTLLTYNRIQPLSVRDCKAILLRASAVREDSRDERVLGRKSGVGNQRSPL